MPLTPELMLILGLGLIAAGLGLIIVEVLIPSGGLIGILAAVIAIAGIVFLWKYDMAWGLSGMLAVMFLGPVIMTFAFKVLPDTPMGKRMFGNIPEEFTEASRQADQEHIHKMAVLVDQVGIAVTPLRPIGTIEIENERYEALADLGAIDSGQRVRVVAVVDNQIKVRPENDTPVE